MNTNNTKAENINALKELELWVNWRYEENEKGKRTKIPYISSEEKRKAKPNDSKTWSLYSEAEKHKELFDGIGVMFGSSLCGIDIDGLAEHTEENPIEKEIFEMFSGTYAEKSPSGKGIHILFYCDVSKLPENVKEIYYMKNPENKVECYFSGLTSRYFTFTGDKISSCDTLADKTETVLTFLDRYMKRPKQESKKSSERKSKVPEIMNADTVIEKIRNSKSGAKFSALFDNGDIGEYNNDNSSADIALCSLAAFYTHDSAVIEEIMNRSALGFRDKWKKREKYRADTISKAINTVSCDYNPEYRSSTPYSVSIKSGAVRADQSQSSGTENTEEAQNVPPFIFYDNDKDKFKVSAPLLAEYMHQNDNYIFVKNNNPNEVSTTLYWYKNGVYSVISPEVLKGYIKKHITDFNPAILAMRHVNEVYGILTAYDEEELIEADRINADENIINFKNGLLYLDTMELKPHSPRVLSTIQIPCNWSGAAGSSPVFDKFMNEFTTGSEEHKRFLLQFMGVCLSNVRGFRMKKALFIVGAGDSGKSQLRKLTEMLIGAKYCESASMKALEETHGGECVVNKRLVGENDMSFMSLNELKIFKLLTGGDSFQINPKNRPMFSYTYNGLLWFTANALPRFGGDRGEHVYNRMIIIKADNVIPPERRDAKLTAKMYKEREAIVYKCVLALKEVIQNGYKFDIPSTCKNELTEYKAENNPVQRFYNECCVMREKKQKDNCTAVKMYEVFKAWCISNNGNHPVSKQNFNKELTALFKVEKIKDIQKTINGTYYFIFTLTPEAKEEYRKIYGYDSTQD